MKKADETGLTSRSHFIFCVGNTLAACNLKIILNVQRRIMRHPSEGNKHDVGKTKLEQ